MGNPGARLTLSGDDAIADNAVLQLVGGGTVVLPASNQVETVGALLIGGLNAGTGFFDNGEFPDNIEGFGQIFVRPPPLDGLLLILR